MLIVYPMLTIYKLIKYPSGFLINFGGHFRLVDSNRSSPKSEKILFSKKHKFRYEGRFLATKFTSIGQQANISGQLVPSIQCNEYTGFGSTERIHFVCFRIKRRFFITAFVTLSAFFSVRMVALISIVCINYSICTVYQRKVALFSVDMNRNFNGSFTSDTTLRRITKTANLHKNA